MPPAARHQQLLGHAHLVEAVGIGLREDVQVGVLAEVGGHADDLGPRPRPARPARGRTARPWSRCPSAAIEAIIAEVVRRGFFSVAVLMPGLASALHVGSPCVEDCERLLPLVRRRRG